MSRILLLSPVPTHPTIAGNRARIHNLINALVAGGNEVVFAHVQRERGDVAAMQACWGEAYLPLPYQQPWSSLRHHFRRLLVRMGNHRGHRLGIDDWYDNSIDSRLPELIAAHDIDAVLVEYCFLSKALLAVPEGVRRLLDTHDSFADRHQRYLQAGMQPQWFSCSPRDERRALDRADTVIAIQEEEAAGFARVTDSQVITVGHLVEIVAQPGDYPTNNTILTLASDNPINRESTRWFIDQVLPRIREHQQDAQLIVAGGVCNKLQPQSGVSLLGRVDDLASLYGSAQVVINPMLAGTGLKIKSIEALGFGKALVSSIAGAEGLTDGSGSAFKVAADANAFAEEVINLLANPIAAAEMASSGQQYAMRYNATCIESLEKVLA